MTKMFVQHHSNVYRLDCHYKSLKSPILHVTVSRYARTVTCVKRMALETINDSRFLHTFENALFFKDCPSLKLNVMKITQEHSLRMGETC